MKRKKAVIISVLLLTAALSGAAIGIKTFVGSGAEARIVSAYKKLIHFISDKNVYGIKDIFCNMFFTYILPPAAEYVFGYFGIFSILMSIPVLAFQGAHTSFYFCGIFCGGAPDICSVLIFSCFSAINAAALVFSVAIAFWSCDFSDRFRYCTLRRSFYERRELVSGYTERFIFASGALSLMLLCTVIIIKLLPI